MDIAEVKCQHCHMTFPVEMEEKFGILVACDEDDLICPHCDQYFEID